MSKVEFTGWARNQPDFNGKQQTEVFFATMNGVPQERAVGPRDVIKLLKLNTPERQIVEERLAPLFDRDNGHRDMQ